MNAQGHRFLIGGGLFLLCLIMNSDELKRSSLVMCAGGHGVHAADGGVRLAGVTAIPLPGACAGRQCDAQLYDPAFLARRAIVSGSAACNPARRVNYSLCASPQESFRQSFYGWLLVHAPTQNELPKNGSIRPQNMTPTHMNREKPATTLALHGASSPEPRASTFRAIPVT